MDIEPISSTCVIVIETDGNICYAHPADNTSAKAFINKLNSAELSIDLYDYNNSKKTGTLTFDLPQNTKLIETNPGDIILCNGSISICLDKDTLNATPIARIENTSKEKLLSVFGNGNIAVLFGLEWSE